MDKKIAWIVSISLFIGFFSGGMTSTKTVETDKNGPTWHTLKSIDDKAFFLAGESMTLCSRGINAVIENDTDKLQTVTELLNVNSQQVTRLSYDREVILKSLGY